MLCPYCQREVDAHTGVFHQGAEDIAPSDGKPPVSGDYTICIYCSRVGVFSYGPVGLSIVPTKPGQQLPKAVRLAALRLQEFKKHHLPERF